MIYIVAAGLEDARQWCHFNGVRRADSVYVGSGDRLRGRYLTANDRIVRTALRALHPDIRAIDAAMEVALLRAGLTETVHGNLVARVA